MSLNQRLTTEFSPCTPSAPQSRDLSIQTIGTSERGLHSAVTHWTVMPRAYWVCIDEVAQNEPRNFLGRPPLSHSRSSGV